MKRLFLYTIFFVACGLNAMAGDIIRAVLVITNAANLNGTNSASLTVNSSTRISTNAVHSASTQWKASTNTTTARDYLLAHVRSFPFSGVQSSATNNGILFIGTESAALALTVSNSWASVTYQTNTIGTSYGVVRIPRTLESATTQARIADGLVDYINFAPTGTVSSAAAAMVNYINLTVTQTISGAKSFTNVANVFVGDGSGLSGVVTVAGTQTVTGAKSLTNTANVFVGASATLTAATIGSYLQFPHSNLSVASAGTNFVADFGNSYQSITATNHVNFLQSTNRNAVRSLVVFVYPNGTNRNLTVPATWHALSSVDAVVTNTTVGILSLTVNGTTETNVFYSYKAVP